MTLPIRIISVFLVLGFIISSVTDFILYRELLKNKGLVSNIPYGVMQDRIEKLEDNEKKLKVKLSDYHSSISNIWEQIDLNKKEYK